MSSSSSYSNAALALTFVPLAVHGMELFFPMWSRYIASYVMPPCGLEFPDADLALTFVEQKTMLDAAVNAAPSEKWKVAQDYIFVLTFEERQGACGFWATAMAALYAMSLPLAQRHPLHFLYMALDVCMTAGNLNHAGVPYLFGYNPMVTTNGRNLGIAFAPFWAVNFYLNYMAFNDSKDAASKRL